MARPKGVFTKRPYHRHYHPPKYKTLFLGQQQLNAKDKGLNPRQLIIGNHHVWHSEFRFLQFVALTLSLALILEPHLTLQQQNQLCPRNCTCDEQTLEIVCKEPIGTSGIPHTLHPATTKIVINNAQTTQLINLEVFAKLEHLDLAGNRLTFIDSKEISKAPSLKFLNASHNDITELRDSALTSLLSHSSSSLLQDSDPSNYQDTIRKLQKIGITSLFIDHNNLAIIANLTFIRWHRLQRLDLSYNKIRFLDSLSLAGLVRLEQIVLRGNSLRQVPTIAFQSTVLSLSSTSSFGTLSAKPTPLRQVDLAENYIHTLESGAFLMLEKLQELNLESCSIQNIKDEAFKGLHSIRLLSLERNNLTEIPSVSFSYLNSIRTLKMNYNQLREIHPYAFSDLINLDELYLNNELINELSAEAFNGLSNIRHLEIMYNSNLTRIEPGTFSGLPKLNYLNLQFNSLKNLPNDLESKSMTYLDLRNNSLICDCDLKWLTKWLKTSSEVTRASNKQILAVFQATEVTISPHHDNYHALADNQVQEAAHLNLTCAGPPALAGRLIRELPVNKLECLQPDSHVNFHIGLGLLFVVTAITTLVCISNFCNDKKHLLAIFKENLVQNHISMVLPHRNSNHKNVDDLSKETQLYGSDYEPVNYGNQSQIQTIHNDELIYCGTQHPYYSQHI